MFTEIYLGYEALENNELGEKTKIIKYSNAPFFCKEKSVKRNEFYQAMSTGLKVDKVVKMNKYEYYDYFVNTQKRYAKVLDQWNNSITEYTIIRNYEVDSDDIELTLQRGVDLVHA